MIIPIGDIDEVISFNTFSFEDIYYKIFFYPVPTAYGVINDMKCLYKKFLYVDTEEPACIH